SFPPSSPSSQQTSGPLLPFVGPYPPRPQFGCYLPSPRAFPAAFSSGSPSAPAFSLSAFKAPSPHPPSAPWIPYSPRPSSHALSSRICRPHACPQTPARKRPCWSQLGLVGAIFHLLVTSRWLSTSVSSLQPPTRRQVLLACLFPLTLPSSTTPPSPSKPSTPQVIWRLSRTSKSTLQAPVLVCSCLQPITLPLVSPGYRRGSWLVPPGSVFPGGANRSSLCPF
ncbi:hypothetical protein DFH06DRAFT_1489631, partial [Mycena polygramma]